MLSVHEDAEPSEKPPKRLRVGTRLDHYRMSARGTDGWSFKDVLKEDGKLSAEVLGEKGHMWGRAALAFGETGRAGCALRSDSFVAHDIVSERR